MKPFVTYEERYYLHESTLEFVSRRKKRIAEKPYLSAVIKDLSNIKIILSNETQNLLIETIETLSKLDGYVKDKLTFFPMLILRTEALSSSQIEHYSASNRNVAMAQINKKQTKEAVIIKSNLETLISGVSVNDEIDLLTIINLNRMLLENENINIRKKVNWIGTPNSLPHEAMYVPPHPDHLNSNMKELLMFCKRDDIHPLLMSAFAHAYFEIIHPFEDGNGRVGRILIQMMLKEKGFLEYIYIPFSVGLVKDYKRYIGSLDDFKDGNYETIIKVILENALALAPKIYSVLESMIELKLSWQQKLDVRKDALAWEILNDLILQPVFDVKYIKDKHKASDQTVRNNIDALKKAGIISTIGNKERDIIYEATEVLSLLDQFVV